MLSWPYIVAVETDLKERVKITDNGALTTSAQVCETVTIDTHDFYFMVKQGTRSLYLASLLLLQLYAKKKNNC